MSTIKMQESKTPENITVIILKFEQYGFYHRELCQKDADCQTV